MARANMDRVFNKAVDAVPDPGLAQEPETTAPEVPAPAAVLDAETKGKPARITFDVTPELHRAYKAWTVTHGTKIKDHLTAYIEQSIRS
ncbi:partitioning protein [Clavibacter michiganensis]|uniref:partitioning protein n=1 Tax=Clavibacter michiganensis TaxID=28447 RepID=UPI0026DC3ED0|nr:partitioning protein [Clavibacter michiganensis]MDO4076458.1 partitioning protein [Clavibacter michiganensis]MDO4132137.1 partitioning protein [Clavibacter michiganensis]